MFWRVIHVPWEKIDPYTVSMHDWWWRSATKQLVTSAHNGIFVGHTRYFQIKHPPYSVKGCPNNLPLLTFFCFRFEKQVTPRPITFPLEIFSMGSSSTLDKGRCLWWCHQPRFYLLLKRKKASKIEAMSQMTLIHVMIHDAHVILYTTSCQSSGDATPTSTR